MKFFITFVILTCILHAIEGSGFKHPEVKRFDGVQMYQIEATTEEQWKALIKMYEEDTLDFWSRPALNRFTNVMIYPDQQSRFKAFLQTHDIQFTILIDNVQTVVEEEKQMINKKAKTRSKDDDTMDFETYHNMSEINDWMYKYAEKHSDIVSVFPIGYSVENRAINALKISTGDKCTRSILLDAGIHAREWITPATAIWVINELVTTKPSILNEFCFHVIPVLNPDGYEYTWAYDRMWRKNRIITHKPGCIGVDLNRNFGTKWGGEGTSSDGCSEIYKGSAPFSEPEAQAFRDFVLRLKNECEIPMYVTLHSYGQYWFTPWGWTFNLTDHYDEQMEMARVAVAALTKVHETKYTYGPSAALLYAAAGGSDDWTYDECGIIYSHCVEVRDAQRFGFELPASQIKPNSEEIYAAVIAGCEHLSQLL